jgi:maleylpyruvate isomerase
MGPVPEQLHESDQRLVRTVDSLTDDQWREPSVLPGWSRAHVVAHLALNAEGLAGVLDGAAHDTPTPMYASQQARDADIEELAAADPPDIRERLFAGTELLREAIAAMPSWDGSAERTPGGGRLLLADVPVMRLREVEIHHADLDAGYGWADWPADFAAELLELAVGDRTSDPDSPVFAVEATDLGRSWQVGGDSPVVRGPAAALGWWLVGRGAGDGLTAEGGALPRLGPWRRTPAK